MDSEPDAQPPSSWQRAVPVVGAAAVLGLYLWQVWRYKFYIDDAFISFRYARHFAEGLGLVWNPGERVEGFTNFLWVMILGIGAWLGIPPENLAWILGVLSGVGLLGIIAWFGSLQHGWYSPWTWIAPLMLANMRSFSTWATGGLASMFFALLAVGGLMLTMGALRSRRTPIAGAAALAACALTRPDGLLWLAVGAATHALHEYERPNGSWKALERWGRVWAVPALLVVALFAFRLSYYGVWLPNTVYAKVEGLRWVLGLTYITLFMADYHGWVLVVVGIIPAVLRRDRESLILVAGLASWVVYLITVGGDLFEFRMLLPVMALLIWLVVDALARLASRSAASASFALVMVAGLFAMTRYDSLRTEAHNVRSGVTSPMSSSTYLEKRRAHGLRLGDLVEQGLIASDTRIATAGAGALPYYSGLYTVDVLGLNDFEIAHGERMTAKRTRLGHEKHATRAYMEERDVMMIDVAGGLVFPASDPGGSRLKRARRRVDLWNSSDGEAPVRLHCRRAPRGLKLLFGSTQSDTAVYRALGHLPRCKGWVPLEVAAPRRR